MLGHNYSGKDFKKEWDLLREKFHEQHKLDWHTFASRMVSREISLDGVEFILSNQTEIYFGQWLKDAAYKKLADVEVEKMLRDG